MSRHRVLALVVVVVVVAQEIGLEPSETKPVRRACPAACRAHICHALEACEPCASLARLASKWQTFKRRDRQKASRPAGRVGANQKLASLQFSSSGEPTGARRDSIKGAPDATGGQARPTGSEIESACELRLGPGELSRIWRHFRPLIKRARPHSNAARACSLSLLGSQAQDIMIRRVKFR
ncbi:Hypothetical predicted protein, partial [Olea europaea subsp. europaea]